MSCKKLFTIYGALHPKSDVDRLYIPRKERGGLISSEDCVDLARRGLEVYVNASEERLIQAARGDKIEGLKAASALKKSKKEKRLEDWKKKVLHDESIDHIVVVNLHRESTREGMIIWEK